MNFGEQNVTKTRKEMSSSAAKVEKKAAVTILRIFFISFLTITLVGFCLVIGIIKGVIDSAPDISEVNIVPSGYATFIYDSDGNQLQKLSAPSANRMSVSIDKIPEDLQHAVVSIEDERFYEHNGIDVQGIIRAAFVGISNGFDFTEGASTITQQLLKNNVFTNWMQEDGLLESLKRKIQEQYLAVQLEKELQNKQVILENYLNTINLGAGTYGVQAASRKYFNKDVQDLTLSEASVIAGITQNPYKFNPITHPDYNAERREKVLRHMVEQGYITEEERAEALADDVYSRIAAAQEIEKQQSTIYSYFVDELTQQVVDDLVNKKGYSESQAYQLLYSGGLRIYTTQDPDIQKICDEEYNNPENFPAEVEYGIDWALSVTKADGSTVNYSQEMMAAYFRENEDPNFDLLFPSEEDAQNHVDAYKAAVMETGDTILAERCNFIPEPQSSLTIIDQYTGYVKAIVGGRGKKTASLTLNRATDVKRQPGSTFKILSTYAPALDVKNMTLATVYTDGPTEYTNGRPVQNASNTYRGDVTIRTAIIDSINTVAVQCITDITPQLGIEYLKKFGFTTISDENDSYQPLALGGIYNGVSNLELCAAYAAIANDGKYIKPIFYTKILDQNGEVILDNTPETTQAIKASTAYLLTSAMQDVVTEGTGTSTRLSNMVSAGKTGTTTSYRDIWFAGYTPYYTCAIWAGYDNNEVLPSEGIYHEYHKILWQKIMTRVHEDLPRAIFTAPSTVEKTTVCSETGKLPNLLCPRTFEYFAADTVPTEICTVHKLIITPTPTPTETPEDTPEATVEPTPTPAPTETVEPTPTPDVPDATETPGSETPNPGTPGAQTSTPQGGARSGPDSGSEPAAHNEDDG